MISILRNTCCNILLLYFTNWDEGMRHIICYINFMYTIYLVEHVGVSTHHHGNEMAIIRKYMAKDWTFQLCHNLKEGNMCAYFLVKLGTRSTSDLLLKPPTELRLLLTADRMGVAYHRGQ